MKKEQTEKKVQASPAVIKVVRMYKKKRVHHRFSLLQRAVDLRHPGAAPHQLDTGEENARKDRHPRGRL